jgi:hypothetical protein
MLSPASMFFARLMTLFFISATFICPSVMATHAVQLDRDCPPTRRLRMGVLLIGVLLVGLVVCGAVHLQMNYRHGASLDGKIQPLNSWGSKHVVRGAGEVIRLGEYQMDDLRRFNSPDRWDFGVGNLSFGIGLTILLFCLCLRWPAWPLHPIGLVMVHTYASGQAWASVFAGWLIKLVMLRYGGARLYRAARPVFLGLIVGEVLAAALWLIVPTLRALMGLEYVRVPFSP